MMTLMAAGGIVAAAGVWLMLREGAGGTAAKVGLGGLEVQSTSAGFAVFLAGTAAFAAPLIAPESTREFVERVLPSGDGLADLGPTFEAGRMGRVTGLVGADNEPQNNKIEGATTVRPGDLAGGTHEGEDVDWFFFDTHTLADNRIEVEISERVEDCHAHFFDGQRQYMGLVSLSPGRNQFRLDVNDNEGFFVQLGCLQSVGTEVYHLSFRQISR